MHIKRSSQKGTTLIELIGSILIFLIGIQALLQVYSQSMRMGKRADYAYTAHNLAKNHMERLKTLDFSLLPSSAETSTAVNGDGDPDPEGSFIRTTLISPNYGGSVLLTQATVQVSYVVQGQQSASPMQISTVILNQ